jgi:hypothetical protein
MATEGIKTFGGNNLKKLYAEVNEYVKERDLEIVSIQRQVEADRGLFKYIITLIWKAKWRCDLPPLAPPSGLSFQLGPMIKASFKLAKCKVEDTSSDQCRNFINFDKTAAMKRILIVPLIGAILLIIDSCNKTPYVPYTIVGSWHELFETGQSIHGGRIDTSNYESGSAYTFIEPAKYSIAGANNSYTETGNFGVHADSVILYPSGANYQEPYLIHFTSHNNVQLISLFIVNLETVGFPPDTSIDIIYLSR